MDESKLTPACRVAKLYLDFVNAQDIKGLRSLFAEDTDYVGPTGASVRDPEVIAAGYKQGFDSMDRQYPKRYKIDNLLPFGKNGCLLEFGYVDDKTGKLTLAAVDRFEVNSEGKITRFLPYFSSAHLPMLIPQIERMKSVAAAAAEKSTVRS